MSDLTSVQAHNKTFDIVHPDTQDPIGLTIELRPESSKEVKAQQRKNTDERLGSKKKNLTAKWVEDSLFRVLVAAVASWKWSDGSDMEDNEPVTFEGEQPECTPENVEKVFKKLPWVLSQVRDEFEDTESFFGS